MTQGARPTVQRVLDSMTGTRAFVLFGRLDILTANQIGYAVFALVHAGPMSLAEQCPLHDTATTDLRQGNRGVGRHAFIRAPTRPGCRKPPGLRSGPENQIPEASVRRESLSDCSPEPLAGKGLSRSPSAFYLGCRRVTAAVYQSAAQSVE